MVEQGTHKPKVVGSKPTLATQTKPLNKRFFIFCGFKHSPECIPIPAVQTKPLNKRFLFSVGSNTHRSAYPSLALRLFD